MKIKITKLNIIFGIILIIIVITGVLFIRNNHNHTLYIDRVLKEDAYSYLSSNTKEYIKRVYESTGELILTEKNKQENTPYLNPKYDNYLSLSEEEKEQVDVIPNTYVLDYVEGGNDNTTYPSVYNLNNVDNNNYLTPINDQGNLGICWAFASIEQAESYLMVKNHESYSENSKRFSTRQMDYATSTNGIKNYENENGFRLLTDGGNYYMSSLIMSYGLSLTNYQEYDESKTKKELADVLNYASSNYELKSSIMMPLIEVNASENEKEAYINLIKENIMKYGGAYVGTGSPTGDCGFKNTDGKYTIVDADNCIGMSGHAMQIVGWDDNYEYSYCRSLKQHQSVGANNTCDEGTLVQKKGAWILRNSWGDDPEYNYVYLGYNSYEYDVNFTTLLSDMSDRKWDNTYHKNIWQDGSVNKKYDTVSFNKKINTKEKIQEVKFIASSSFGEYNISIESENSDYKNIKTISVDYPGTYTIDLTDNNIIINDAQFKVTINSTNDTYLASNTISVYSKNVENTPEIKTDNISGSKLRLDSDENYEYLVYSSTKNISSNEIVTYSLTKDNLDYSNYLNSYSNNIVAENNINATLIFDKSIQPGDYTLNVKYNNQNFTSTLTIPVITNLEGAGTSEDPYLIYNQDDLNQIRYHLDAYYLLKNDINLTGNWVPIGTYNEPFRGGFDGDNHTITGLKIEEDSDSAVGLFGYVNPKFDYTIHMPEWIEYYDKSFIRNLNIKNASVSNRGNASILIGQLNYDISIAPQNASNINSPSLSIENVHFIDGNLKSKEGDAGVIVGNTNVMPAGHNQQYLNINNTYSSVMISGKHSMGLIGYINDVYESGSGIMLKIEMTNFQNVGVLDVNSLECKYSSSNNYSAVIGGVYGNVKIILNNYIINSIFNDISYMQDFTDLHPLYFIGYFDPETSLNLAHNVTHGYYVTKYYNGENYTDASNIKDRSIYNSWEDFDDYWEIETIDNIVRIPVLKNIDYEYTDIDNISLNKYDEVSLLDYVKVHPEFQYINYNVISNDDVIDISRVLDNHVYNDISIKALKSGTATIHVINNYDGFEKDVIVTVNTEKVNKPVITYYANIENDSRTYTQQVNALESFTLAKNQFTKAGYKFIGWNTKADGTGTTYNDEDTIESGIDENIRLYAMWETKKYTIKFDANGGTGSMNDIENVILSDNQTVIIPNNVFTKEGYIFNGWNTKADGSGTSFNNGDSINFEQLTSIDGEVMTLYARWILNKHSLSFDANGGVGNMSALDINTGSSVNIPSNTFTRDGYKFINWNTKADGSGDSYEDGQLISLTSDLKLYAQWLLNIGKITFNANYGSNEVHEQSITFDEVIKLKKNTFTRSGYHFKEWNTKASGSGTSYSDGQNVRLSSNLVLYAIWVSDFTFKINNYSVDETNKYISKIMPNTEISTFTSNFNLGQGYNLNVESKTVNNKKVLYTGGKTKIIYGTNIYATYTNVVIGDISGDGAVNSADLLKIRQHLLNKNILSGYYFLASDINYDNAINSADLLRLRQHLIGTKKIN